jgi:8-oxo-dGTP pyrophosphatase MutT (NUDIX family)
VTLGFLVIIEFMPKMKEYVVGFALDSHFNVILIRKNRPDWQAGKLNGVGGRIEEGETPMQAMIREFEEETGTYIREWTPLFVLNSLKPSESIIHFYRTFVSDVTLEGIEKLGGITDEKIVVENLTKLLPHNLQTSFQPPEGKQVVNGLTWMLPLAAHQLDTYNTFNISELPSP